MRTDVGAEAMLQRRPEGVALARAVGLGDDVLAPATASAALWTRGTMRPIPRSLMGVPGDLAVLEGVLSTEGLAGARLDARLGPLAALAPDDDVSVGDLVADRLGEEVVQRLVEPMLGGVYAGHAHALSARAAVPGLLARLDGTRTLVEAAAAAMTPAAGAGGPVFAGIRGGVGRLPGAALAASGAELQTGAMVRGLRRTTTGWALEVGPTRSPWLVEADAVVLATPARPTSRLLEPVAPVVAAELAGIEYASMVVVTLAVRGFDGCPGPASWCRRSTDVRSRGRRTRSPSGTGSARRRRTVCGCSAARSGGTARSRCSSAPTRRSSLSPSPTCPPPSAPPCRSVDAAVRRWGGGLPQYAVGHLARVARIRAGLCRRARAGRVRGGVRRGGHPGDDRVGASAVDRCWPTWVAGPSRPVHPVAPTTAADTMGAWPSRRTSSTTPSATRCGRSSGCATWSATPTGRRESRGAGEAPRRLGRERRRGPRAVRRERPARRRRRDGLVARRRPRTRCRTPTTRCGARRSAGGSTRSGRRWRCTARRSSTSRHIPAFLADEEPRRLRLRLPVRALLRVVPARGLRAARMLAEHGMMARDYKDVRANTVAVVRARRLRVDARLRGRRAAPDRRPDAAPARLRRAPARARGGAVLHRTPHLRLDLLALLP